MIAFQIILWICDKEYSSIELVIFTLLFYTKGSDRSEEHGYISKKHM